MAKITVEINLNCLLDNMGVDVDFVRAAIEEKRRKDAELESAKRYTKYLETENIKLHEVIGLAENDARETCRFCAYPFASERCTSCKGKNWTWKHADMLKDI